MKGSQQIQRLSKNHENYLTALKCFVFIYRNCCERVSFLMMLEKVCSIILDFFYTYIEFWTYAVLMRIH